MKFSFIHAEKGVFPVGVMCRLLGVTRQGYYAFASRRPSRRVHDDAQLQERVRAVHVESGHRYGSPRVQSELRDEGLSISKRRVERAMRSQGLAARRLKRFRVTTTPNTQHPVEPNLLARDFCASRPNERWITDITDVWTDEGWCYLAVVLDLFSRAVVGWSLDTTLSTTLALGALSDAVRKRRPEPGLLCHSDRGCQYTSAEYRSALADLGITVSMSRTGNCWDNAVAESFFATLKTELVHERRWRTRNELRNAVFEYIKAFYDRRRRHSSLGYRSPAAFESAHAPEAAA